MRFHRRGIVIGISYADPVLYQVRLEGGVYFCQICASELECVHQTSPTGQLKPILSAVTMLRLHNQVCPAMLACGVTAA